QTQHISKAKPFSLTQNQHPNKLSLGSLLCDVRDVLLPPSKKSSTTNYGEKICKASI
ncbi:hypothetical protein GIB67_040868, partial [Kingdonia uniflora]